MGIELLERKIAEQKEAQKRAAKEERAARFVHLRVLIPRELHEKARRDAENEGRTLRGHIIKLLKGT